MALTDNLISYWSLDEASGNAIDAHGSNDLTDNNTVGSAMGKVANARDFEAGNSEYLSHADNADLSMGDINFTIAAWVKGESFSSDHMIVAKSNTGDFEYYVWYNSPGGFRVAVRNGADSAFGQVNSTFGAATPGSWYFVVAWHDATNDQLGISINAGVADIVSHSGGVRNGTAEFRIGSRQADGLYWDGLIDEVAMWKRVLTSDERARLYNNGNGLAFNDILEPIWSNDSAWPDDGLWGGSVWG